MTSIADNLNRIINAKTAIRQAIVDKGVEVPDTEKIDTYHNYIDQISTGGGYDPDNPTLEGLKAALDAGDKYAFPANTTIPDTYNGEAFNWVVGHYGTATMSDNSTKEGVYLFADHIVAKQTFGSNAEYSQSAINAWLNNTFLPACSDTMRNMVGEISVTGSDAAHAVNAKVWLMSVGEIIGGAPSTSNGGGVAWDAWRVRTGLSSPSANANNGRIMKEASGSAYYWWTRSFYPASRVWYVPTNGYVYSSGRPPESLGVIPALFIPKGESAASNPAEDDGTDWGTLYTTEYPDGLVLEGKDDFNNLGNSNRR